MADLTKIEWCDATINPWHGCTKVSLGCQNCYALTQSTRYGKNEWGPTGTRTEIKSWRAQLAAVSKRAKTEGRRMRVFVASMSDIFEGPETMGGVESENWQLVARLRQEFLELIPEHPELDFLLLTKRPENVLKYGRTGMSWTIDGIPPNVWIGTSVEDQKTADKRIPHLLTIPAKVRFLSCEPLLSPVDLRHIGGSDKLTGAAEDCPFTLGFINWVIVGGESGPKARPMHPDWARSLRDQCHAAAVPFLFKQWGNNNPISTVDGRQILPFGDYDVVTKHGFKHGEKNARVLDGRTWDEFPEVIR